MNDSAAGDGHSEDDDASAMTPSVSASAMQDESASESVDLSELDNEEREANGDDNSVASPTSKSMKSSKIQKKSWQRSLMNPLTR